jgi:uncharacterized protein YkwD
VPALALLRLAHVTAFVRRSLLAKVTVVSLVAALMVSGLLVGLPSRPVSANPPPTYGPKGPIAVPSIVTGLGLGSPFRIEFSKTMNEASVASSLTVSPDVKFHLEWDTAGQIVSLLPDSHWAPDTYYSVDVAPGAHDHDGMSLGVATDASFLTDPATKGKISASSVIGDSIAVTTSFLLTFSAPVKLATVQTALHITPLVGGTISGDDDSDAASQVFTFTPDAPLALGLSYVVSFSAATMNDASGTPLASITPVKFATQTVPSVMRFRPRDGSTNVEPGQAVSVRFTTKMDEAATTPAFSVTADGQPVTGKTYWAENDTVLVLTPSSDLPIGAKVVAGVSTDAMSASGLHMTAAASGTFTVAKPSTRTIPQPTGGQSVHPTGGLGAGDAQWHAAEVYFLKLTNCTRTGGWVLSGGVCRSSGPHTLPAARALTLDAGISTRVSRPFARFMAERGILNHFANGTPGQRLARAGYTSYHWAENIGSPSNANSSGMEHDALLFQNEYRCQCDHYENLMNSAYDRAGVGVWVSRGRVRVVIDFYHP